MGWSAEDMYHTFMLSPCKAYAPIVAIVLLCTLASDLFVVYFATRYSQIHNHAVAQRSVSSAQLGSVKEDSHGSASMFYWTRKNVAVIIAVTAAILF